MLQHIKTYKDIVIFSQWSRKSYAAFASLNKVVCIGYLSIDIYKHALLKNVAFAQILNILCMDNYKNLYCNIVNFLNKSIHLLASLPMSGATNDTFSLVVINNE